MTRFWPKSWAVTLAILCLGAGAVVGPAPHDVQAQQPASSNNKSWTDSITSPIKAGFNKLGSAVNPKPATPPANNEDDAISLKNKGKPGPELYVAVARLFEQAGKLDEADEQYRMAMRENPNYLPALLGYAHLKDLQGKPNDALQFYQRAVKAYPKQASVHNNLGLYYAQHDRLDDAVAAMKDAIQLDSKNPLYRNNIATVLVDQGKVSEAFEQLRAVHGDTVAHYNMGYLLNKKGQTQAALQHFTLAANADSSMVAARRWAEYLRRSMAQARLGQHPMSSGVRVTTPSAKVAEEAPMPPNDPALRRLPPTSIVPPDSSGPSLPGISYERPTSPTAPLPPQSADSRVRPLPRVN